MEDVVLHFAADLGDLCGLVLAQVWVEVVHLGQHGGEQTIVELVIAAGAGFDEHFCLHCRAMSTALSTTILSSCS